MNRALVTTQVVLLAALIAVPAFATPPAPAPSAAQETGRVVVGITSSVSDAQLEKTVKKSGGRVVGTIDSAGLAVVDPRAGLSADRVSAKLEDEAGVRFAEPEQVVHALFTPNDPSYTLQWGLARIGAPAAWNVQRGSATVRVAVVDSGVDYTHPDLVGRLDTANGYDFIDNDTQAQDSFGHGTHIAGIIAADTNNGVAIAGLAGGSLIMPVRALDSLGDGTDVGVAQGIRWAADHGADVINLSLGTPEPSMALQEACDYAIARDCVVVAASGNSAAQTTWVPGQIQHPAAYAPVVAVGAIDSAGARASFSEWGSALDLMAPGVGIVSLYPVVRGGQVTISGTSMATAHVSGVAALLRSQNSEWSAAQTIARLEDNAEDLGVAGTDDQFGHGLVRADLALGVTNPPPVGPPADGDTLVVPVEDVGTIANVGGGTSESGAGAGVVHALSGSAASEDDTLVAEGGAGTDDAADEALAGGTGASSGGQSPAAPAGTTEEPGKPTRRVLDLFTIALLAVAAFAGVGFWRRAKGNASV